MSFTERIKNFFREVIAEAKKVNWPTREETVRYTLIVIGVSIAVSLFLGGLDYLFSLFLKTFFLEF